MRVVSAGVLVVLGVGCEPGQGPESLFTRQQAAITQILVAKGSTWRYKDDGSNQGVAWRAQAFDDRSWKSGRAELGYGDRDEATVVSYGADPKNKYVTTYFRQTFTVTDPTRYRNLILRLLADDAGAVYLNGNEVYRENLPGGALGYLTYAVTTGIEGLFVQRNISPSMLVPGMNVLAIEVHQATQDSSDLSFDLELRGTDGLVLTRGPYLQSGAPRRVVVRWRTDVPSDSRVRYGTSAANLFNTLDDPKVTTEHELVVTRNLIPNTKYYYSVGSTRDVLAGGDTEHFFVTPPISGPSKPTRIWVLGDAGLANTNVMAVRDAYATHADSRQTDLWLMLGDNAYDSGTDDQFQKAVFEMYPTLLRQTFVWPTIGNHETYHSATGEAETHLEVFTLPARGESGGVPSGTEKYYSFDFGNIHFVCLDSMSSNRQVGGAMLTWLASDLAANTRTWLIAFWHHPPYSKGNHDSDFEQEHIDMRENALPILERHGVDLVLGGHSHVYERSYLIDGHYGSSDTLTASMVKQAGSGRPNEEGGPYAKSSTGPGPNEGAVYLVTGSGAYTAPGSALNHPAMYVGINELGSVMLDVDGLQLDGTFLRETGAVEDRFRIKKGSATAVTSRPGAPTEMTGASLTPGTARLSWKDNSTNEVSFKLERSVAGSDFEELATLGVNATAHVDRRLWPRVTYWYRVKAVNAAGDSEYSNIVTVRIRECDMDASCPDVPRDAGADGDTEATDGAVVIMKPQGTGTSGCAVGGTGAAPVWCLLLLALALRRRR